MQIEQPFSRVDSIIRQNKKLKNSVNCQRFNFHKSGRQFRTDLLPRNDKKTEKQCSFTRSTLSLNSGEKRHRYDCGIGNRLNSPKKLSNDFKLPYFKKEIRKESKTKRKKHNSPLKKSKNYKLLHSFLKNAQPTRHSPVEDETDEKKKILHNIYYKNEKYYYSSKISFQTILRKIYYENYKIKNVKEYIIPCFKRLKSVRNYFDILFREAKSFSETIKKLINKKLLRVLKDDRAFSDETTDTLQYGPRIKSFSKAIRNYTELIDLLFDSYQHLENVNYEIEKLTKIYLENYIEKSESVDFDTLLFHKSMFINNVYKDERIHTVIEELYEFFCRNSFYSRNFRELVDKVSEIYDNLEYGFDYDEDCHEDSCKCDSLSSDSLDLKTEAIRHEPLCEDKQELEEKKPKKKRKKKKKNKKQASPPPPQDKLSPGDRLKFIEFCRRLSVEKPSPRRLKLVLDKDGSERLC